MPYYINGDVTQYLRASVIEERYRVTLSLVLQVTDALEYLHSSGITHKDIRGSNILVDGHGSARLTDVGLAPVLGTAGLFPSMKVVPSPRWAPPELIRYAGDASGAPFTTRSDVYSLGMTIYEMLALKKPFDGIRSESHVCYIVWAGQRPAKPEGYNENLHGALWSIIQECWKSDPTSRPTVADVRTVVQNSSLHDP
ncbi:kinase-like protein [Neolentinus lepideus HHB14362 ss-1]|uniref:Kinase-like protein n=1 Tax=Neolentinus lepideus HHB14362 ss-1 TaxID=1314782 RepID=A0A165VSB8_9AGAM|nr:kinase-like protein [Neolentinus lepideus HHB14362 ss-1]